MEPLSTEATLDLLVNGKIAHIGVIDDAEPYVSPVSYVVIDQEFCFRTGSGRRVDAIRDNPIVSIETMRSREDGGWECVIARGEAYEVDDPQKAQAIVSAMLRKYSDEIGSPLSSGSRGPMEDTIVIVCVRMSEISGRTSGTWFSIPTRPGRL